jgi:hypothetical protein
MCGRYSLGDSSPLMRRFGLEEFAENTITPRFIALCTLLAKG